MTFKKTGFLYFLLTLNIQVQASEHPSLLCYQSEKIQIDPISFKATSLKGLDIKKLDLYRFEDNKMYISNPNQTEYFYDNLKLLENFRYLSGRKIIMFSSNFQQVIVSHIASNELSTIKLKCFPKK
jgi:hypothetical protein